jgi:signal transduction histidine kinase
VSAGIRASVEVEARASYPPELAWTAYACCEEALEHASTGARVSVRDEGDALAFEVTGRDTPEPTAAGAGLERLRDLVEALGGSLTIRPAAGGGTCIAGRLPLPR